MPHTHPVLIAEDDEDTRFFLERSLQKAGVRNPVKIVNDGQQALDYLQKDDSHKTPRIVLLDIKMPGVDGFDVLKRVRADPRLSRLPVVMLSNSNDGRDVNRAYDLGANSYVVKPSDPDQLQSVLTRIHNYWMNINEEPRIE